MTRLTERVSGHPGFQDARTASQPPHTGALLPGRQFLPTANKEAAESPSMRQCFVGGPELRGDRPLPLYFASRRQQRVLDVRDSFHSWWSHGYGPQ